MEIEHILNLKVSNGYPRDEGIGIARIGQQSMDRLCASEGDVIEIIGKKRTVATCHLLKPTDLVNDVIRIDEIQRKNAEIEVGEMVSIKKIKSVIAKKVVIKPFESISPRNEVKPLEEFPYICEERLSENFENIPVIKGDCLRIPSYFCERITFQVTDTIPDEVVLINLKTDVEMIGNCTL